MDAEMTAKVIKIIRTSPNQSKLQDSPTGPVKWTPDKLDGLRNPTDVLSICTDAYIIGNRTETAEEEAETINKH